MGYLKISGLLAMTAAVLLAFAGVAEATQVTSPSGTVYTSTVKAEAEGAITLHNSSIGISVSCKKSTFEGKVESHGVSSTAGGKISSLTFTECGNTHTHVTQKGIWEVHTEGINNNGNGIWTSSGLVFETTITEVGLTCTYSTNNTPLGVVTGGSNATIDINSATIPRTGGSVFCGSSGQLTGSYKITTPSTLLVD